jgi:hypothetical protein
MRDFRQEIETRRWLDEPIAVLRLTPAELTHRLGLRFYRGHDDLDSLEWAEVVGQSGRTYGLVHHDHAPKQGTDVLTRIGSDSFSADLDDVLDSLGLGISDVSWKHPDVLRPHVRSTRARSGETAGAALREAEVSAMFAYGIAHDFQLGHHDALMFDNASPVFEEIMLGVGVALREMAAVVTARGKPRGRPARVERLVNLIYILRQSREQLGRERLRHPTSRGTELRAARHRILDERNAAIAQLFPGLELTEIQSSANRLLRSYLIALAKTAPEASQRSPEYAEVIKRLSSAFQEAASSRPARLLSLRLSGQGIWTKTDAAVFLLSILHRSRSWSD